MPFRVVRSASHHRPRSPQWSESEAREILAACDDSGLSHRKFCAHHGVTPSRLDYWRKRLATTIPHGSFVEFSPLIDTASQRVSLPLQFVTPSANDSAGRWIEIHVGGVVLRVRETLGARRLARIVGELTRASRAC